MIFDNNKLKVKSRFETRQKKEKNNTWDSNVVPHRSTNQARRCLTSLSRREAVLSSWYGRSCPTQALLPIQSNTYQIRQAITLEREPRLEAVASKSLLNSNCWNNGPTAYNQPGHRSFYRHNVCGVLKRLSY